MAVGEIMMGIESLKPRIVVVMSILDTSISIRGRNLHKTNANRITDDQQLSKNRNFISIPEV
jgi:hypothetical protein